MTTWLFLERTYFNGKIYNKCIHNKRTRDYTPICSQRVSLGRVKGGEEEILTFYFMFFLL